jgi:hypothetical protein
MGAQFLGKRSVVPFAKATIFRPFSCLESGTYAFFAESGTEVEMAAEVPGVSIVT